MAGVRGHGGHHSPFELQINQGLLFNGFPFSPRSPRLHKVNCACAHADRPEGWVVDGESWGGELSPAGLA